MAALTVLDVTSGAVGLTGVAGTVTTGDTFINDGHTWLYVENGTGAQTLTIKTTATYQPGSLTIADKVINLAASTKYLISPRDFPQGLVGSPVTIIVSAATVLVKPFHTSIDS